MSGKPEAFDVRGYAALTGVSRETRKRLEAFSSTLIEWSSRINLVSRGTLNELWWRHIFDSSQIIKILGPAPQNLVDLGSGAGFPGLVLAILGVPGVELIEADARKCAFLREAARVTGTVVTIHNSRIEAVPPHRVDIVTARGCAPLDRLLPLAERFIGPGTTCLFLKGAKAEEELTAAGKAWTMQVTRHPSRTDPGGVILSLQQVVREPRRA
ncbi:MAG TPA: 16S rRNA (guanine(527)-N(7))-methyltransferase RsmG [Stellaceae bacterium]|nr:16S rRNA (guanine(527)-N(7))-methyltransferase RsmG [Stellaceae bacterium]